MDRTLIFSTPHGSRLYGLHHVDSDYDRFDVYGWDKFRPKQTIAGSDDVTKASFDRFMLYCDKGVPQYLEAMFSQMATVNEIKGITDTYVPNMTNVNETYNRTIKSFWMFGMENDDYKRRRHAWRLWLNLQDMRQTGRFNPTLQPFEILFVERSADKNDSWFQAPPSIQEEK